MTESMQTKLLYATTLELPPSCMEMDPLNPGVFLVGTYLLEDNPAKAAKRSGSLLTFQMLGIDLRDLLAVATSAGTIALFHVDFKDKIPIRDTYDMISVSTPEILVLSINWAPSSLYPSLVVATLSDGAIAILNAKELSVLFKCTYSHSLEAWCVQWSFASGRIALFSGGDDSVLYRHQIEADLKASTEFHVPNPDVLFLQDSKTHGAGVTSIALLGVDRRNNEILLTGSYDEYVRILCIEPLSKRARVLAEKRLDGGVWQLRQLDTPRHLITAAPGDNYFLILASCMHDGCKVLDIRCSAEEIWTIEVLAKFQEHQSMNYASDARMGPSGQTIKDMTFVSTSFYDKKLCVWTLEES
ncbi:MAG: hypothetical protein Q9220_004466 [cf. Caloplaca sp. 1 TL-2023]